MTIAEKLVKVAEDMPKVYEAGQKSEYDRFWDAFQNNGGIINGTYMLAGYGWKDDNYNPKYPIKLSSCTGLFRFSQLTDTKVAIDLTGSSVGTHLFHEARLLKNIPLLEIKESTTYANWFDSCFALEEIRFEGTIGQSLDLHWSTKLSMLSLASIIKALSKTASGQSITLPTTARQTYDNATISGRWDELVAEYPNWSFKYA